MGPVWRLVVCRPTPLRPGLGPRDRATTYVSVARRSSIRRVAFEKQKASLVGSRTGTRCGSIRRVAVRLREAEGVVAPGAVHLHVFRHRTAAVHEGVMIGADAAPADPMIYLFIRQPVGFVTRALLVGF